jgi:uncharacterized protein GlcG (DUF336 family)
MRHNVMRHNVALLAAAAALVLTSGARADDSDKFLIRGNAAKRMMEQNQLNVATAEAIGKACVEEAAKQGVGISIVVLDQFGEPVYFYRMDGQGKINIETAFMKARTVLNTRAPSKAAMNQVLTGRSSEARQISFGNFPNSGALPILVNGNQFVGAVGVGGSAPRLPEWSDEICAHRALTKVMGPQPALLPDVPPNTPTR